MSMTDNIKAVRSFYDAGPSADDRDRAAYAAPDIVWHVPGENHVSGDYRGYREVFGVIGERMAPLDEWELDVVDVMGNADVVMATVRVRGLRRGRRIDMAGGHVFRLDAQARIVEAWGFTADQAALDRFLDA